MESERKKNKREKNSKKMKLNFESAYTLNSNSKYKIWWEILKDPILFYLLAKEELK